MSTIPNHIKKIATDAIKEVPAYKEWLKQNKCTIKKVLTDADFFSLPVTDKEHYIYKFPNEKLFRKDRHPINIYASSGSSGKPTFWFRGIEQEKMGADLHEIIFRDIFGIKKNQKTLVVVTFSMGIWVAGNFTAAAIQKVAERGYKITVATPGIEREDIFSVLKNIAPDYDAVVLCGYPPFLMDVVLEAKGRGIEFANKDVFALTAGDKFTEEWRDTFMKAIHKENNPSAIVGVYGSADAVMMGFETPLSIFLRRQALKNKELYEELFGAETILPNISQFDTRYIHFETSAEELLITAPTAIPLIRYNIHDRGVLKSQKEIQSILKKYNLDSEAKKMNLNKWKLPVVIVKGRTDVAATYYALNIYPDHIRVALEAPQFKSLLSGNFVVYNKESKNAKKQELHVDVELAPGTKKSKEFVEKIKQHILKQLLRLNIEYRKLYASLGASALPMVTVYAHNHHPSSVSLGPKLVNIKGKKPRVILN